MQTIETSRFGKISIAPEDVLHFTEGILGFSKLVDYVLIERVEDPLFLWLQSLKKSSVAFPLLEPQLFEKHFKLELPEEDSISLKVKKDSVLKAYCIITIPSDPSKMTANLKAPIVVNLEARLAKQVILEKDYPIRKAIYSDIQAYCNTQHSRPSFESDSQTTVPQYQTFKISDAIAASA